MAIELQSTFDSDVDGFSAGTWTGAQGNGTLGGTNGVLAIGPGVTSTRDFTGITSGITRFDFRFKVTDSTTAADASSNHFVYFLANGVAPASASSIATIAISRNTTQGATSTHFALIYRGASAFSVFDDTPILRRGEWWYKLSIVADWTAKTCDIYLNDVLWLRVLTWPNTAAANVGRVAFVGSASAPTSWFDDAAVESAWAIPSESTMVSDDFTVGSGAVNSSTPSTDTKNIHAQPWVAPSDTTYGVATRSTNGLAWEASKKNVVLCRTGAEGIWVAKFKAATSGGIYGGVMVRVWGGPATDAWLVFRYWSGSGSPVAIFESTNTVASGTLSGVTISAGDEYELKVELRGRFVWAYVRNVTTAGSFQLQFSGPARMSTNTKGARGLLCEDMAGVFYDATIGTLGATNYCESFTYTGRDPNVSTVKDIGPYAVNVEIGTIREIYVAGSGGSALNPLWSRGFQFAHKAENDMGEDYSAQQITIYDAASVASYRQTGICMSEDTVEGYGDSYVTLLQRGPWISDGVYAFNAGGNWAPDNDFRPTYFVSNGWRSIVGTGASTLQTHGFHDWTTLETAAAAPVGQQLLASFASGNALRITEIVRNDINASALNVGHKNAGDGSPISIPNGISSVAASTQIRGARAILLETSGTIALSDADIQAYRDDIKTPATLTFTIGAAKTDAAGDTDADGFNERHGWYEITCAGGTADFTLPIASGTRHKPAFRLHSWTNTNTGLTIGGTPAVLGADYVIDEVAPGIAVLQLLSNRTANTALALTTSSGAALAGAAVAQATATGALLTAIPLAGSAVAMSVAGGNLVTTIHLAGAALASAQAIGALTAQIKLSGAAVAAALASGSLTTGAGGLSGSALAQSTATGTLTTGIPLVGSATAVATATGGLGAPIALDGVAAAVSSATGDLTVSIQLSGAAAAQAAAAASLTTIIVLSGAALAAAAASGVLGGGMTFVPTPGFIVRATARNFRVAA